MRHLTPILLLACGLVACRGNKANATPPSSPAGPDLPCPDVAAKIVTCIDDFEPAYALTEEAGKRGRATADGPLDGKKGAERLMIAFRHEHNRASGVELCNTQWATRDPAWRTRLLDCDLTKPCGTWSACAGPAIGSPMKPGNGKQ